MENEELTGTNAAPHAAELARRDWVVPLINALAFVSVGGMALGAMVLAFNLVLKLIDKGVRIDLAIGVMALGLLTFLLALFIFSRKLPNILGASPPFEGARQPQAALPGQTRPQLDAPREPASSVADYTTRSLEHARGARPSEARAGFPQVEK